MLLKMAESKLKTMCITYRPKFPSFNPQLLYHIARKRTRSVVYRNLPLNSERRVRFLHVSVILLHDTRSLVFKKAYLQSVRVGEQEHFEAHTFTIELCAGLTVVTITPVHVKQPLPCDKLRSRLHVGLGSTRTINSTDSSLPVNKYSFY